MMLPSAEPLVRNCREALLEICQIEEITISELCSRAKVTRQAFYDAFGAGKTPTLLTLHRYAHAVGCDVQVSFVPRTDVTPPEAAGRNVPGYLEEAP